MRSSSSGMGFASESSWTDRERERLVRAGKTTSTIRSEIGDDWDIWTMGCPEGESPDQIRDRCDRVIKKIVEMAE